MTTYETLSALESDLRTIINSLSITARQAIADNDLEFANATINRVDGIELARKQVLRLMKQCDGL